MRLVLGLGLCFVLAGTGMAQRGGGHMGGGFRGGGGYRGGGVYVGGYHGGYGYGYHGYWGGYGYRGYGWGYPGYYYGGFWPYFSIGYWSGLYGYPYYSYPYYYGYPYSYPYSYPYTYQQPGVTAVYPSASAVNAAPASSSVRVSNSREVRASNAPPVYLIAFNDRSVRAAEAYWVKGPTLYYVTLEHEQRQMPLDAVDRTLTVQLNRELHVPFQLPIAQ